MKKEKWQWDCGGKFLMAERNTARDVKLVRLPENGDEEILPLHTGEKKTVVTWQWPGDNRVFMVPMEILDILSTAAISLARDIILVLGHLYREQEFPKNRVVTTNCRQLAKELGLAWGSSIREDMKNALLIARWYTIQDHPIIKKVEAGRVKEKGKLTFGFISWWERLVMRDGKEIPENKQPLNICLTEPYAYAIAYFPPAPVPVLALEAAHNAPRRLRTPVKNLIYYLAARVPLEYVSLSTGTLAEILGFQNDHRTELARSIENVIKVLHPVMVRNYVREDGVYKIFLAGKIASVSSDTPRGTKKMNGGKYRSRMGGNIEEIGG